MLLSYSGYQMCPTHINSYTEIGHKILVPQVIHEIDPMPSIFLFQYQISSNTDEFIYWNAMYTFW